jgi:hypothetical protein
MNAPLMPLAKCRIFPCRNEECKPMLKATENPARCALPPAYEITPLKIPYPFARLFDSINPLFCLPKTLSHPMQQHGNNLFKQLYTLNQSPSCNAYI